MFNYYYEWPLELSLSDSKGKIVAKTTTSVDITKWLPGVTVTTQSIKIPKSLKQGKYKLCVAIIDPSTGKPSIKLGIEGIRPDGRYALNNIMKANNIIIADKPSRKAILCL